MSFELYWLQVPPEEGGRRKIRLMAEAYAKDNGLKFLGIRKQEWHGGKHKSRDWWMYSVEFEVNE